MQDNQIAAIVVVYNTFCGDSPTCRGLMECQDRISRIVIYDNSTADYSNREFCRERNWVYMGGEGNKGLSVAYNQSITRLLDDGFSGIVCLFDDDTHLESAYLDALAKADWNRHNIHVPVIYSAGMIISPCIFKKNYASCGVFADETQVHNYTGDNLTAINSCMAMNISLFADYRYDENLFLDCIDHKFLRDMKAKGETVGLLDYRCNHEFSGHAKPSKASALARFRIYVKDLRYLLRNKLFAYLWIAGLRMQYLVRYYRSFDFLKIYLCAICRGDR